MNGPLFVWRERSEEKDLQRRSGCLGCASLRETIQQFTM